MPKLSRHERNEIFRALVAVNIDPADCEFDPSERPNVIRHIPTDSMISVAQSQLTSRLRDDGTLLPLPNVRVVNQYHVTTKIGTEPERTLNTSATFESLLSEVSKWATEVRDWTESQDLWELSRSGRSIPGDLSPDSANTPFTPDEQAAISAQLKAIAESVKKTYDLTAEQSAKVDKKFEEADKASRRMGRKDWGLLFGGAILSLIFADVITPGVAGHILMMIEHGLGHLFGGPPVGGVLSAGRG